MKKSPPPMWHISYIVCTASKISSNITHMSDENAYNWYFRLHSYSRLDMLKFMCNWVMSFTFPLFQSHYKGCYYFWEHIKYFYWGNMCTSTHVTANPGPESPLLRYCHSNKRLWLSQTHLVVIETRDKSHTKTGRKMGKKWVKI